MSKTTVNSATSASESDLRSRFGRALLRALMVLLGLGFSLLLLIVVALATIYPKLPDIVELSDYRPKLSMRIYSAEGHQIGEFGEERRKFVPFQKIPQVMKDAVLAIEDARFYQHRGIDYIGLMRAGLANLSQAKSQGASTITMQVARNVYLTSEKTFSRKLFEVLLTLKLEHVLTKDQIFEIYLNQIFLGQRSYGFASATETYFGIPLKDIGIAQAAMLAGLPKAPSAFNPISNPKRARLRQLYIIERMQENGFITPEQAAQAASEPLQLRNPARTLQSNSEFAAEMVRQLMYEKYGSEIYTRGLQIHTTLRSDEQQSAYLALRRGILDYEQRQHYRGPELFLNLPKKQDELDEVIDDALLEQGDKGDLLAAVVLEVSAKRVVVARFNQQRIEISGDGLKPVQSGLSDNAPPKIKLRPGAVVRILYSAAKERWDITQLPEVEGAFVAINPRDGSIRALVGGFDFQKNKFNHVTQAWRQPGSAFKPFIYSAALEQGFTPSTMINDAALYFDSSVTGGQPWTPKNYDGKFEGMMSMRTALAKSKNMVSIRILQAVGADKAQQWISRFGFDPERHPPYLTMALGAGAVTPLQMAVGYSVFSNGGYRVNPYLITKITDNTGRVLHHFSPASLNELPQAIEPRNAFLMNQLLNEVTRSGTAARAQALLQRTDLYGKTGTTNDAHDAWFAGYTPTIAAVTWIGYDSPRKLGDRETGGGLSLPVWIQFMQQALKTVPVTTIEPPAGVTQIDGEWYYTEFNNKTGVLNLGSSGTDNGSQPLPTQEEKNRILDLFRN